MNTKRLDGWGIEEERLLAEIILNSIRRGDTQLSAFQEAGHQLKRTPTACGHRWNRVLRKEYASQIADAKSYWRLNQGKSIEQPSVTDDQDVHSPSMESLVHNIQHIQQALEVQTNSEKRLTKEIESLREEVTQLVQNLYVLRQDTQIFLRIFEQSLKQFLQETQTQWKSE